MDLRKVAHNTTPTQRSPNNVISERTRRGEKDQLPNQVYTGQQKQEDDEADAEAETASPNINVSP